MNHQDRPKNGQWVRILAKVVDNDPHPDEVRVEMFSHNEQYHCLVRLDDIVDVVQPPWPDEPGDGAVVLVGGIAYQRRDQAPEEPTNQVWFPAGRERGEDWATLVRDSWDDGKDRPEVVSEP